MEGWYKGIKRWEHQENLNENGGMTPVRLTADRVMRYESNCRHLSAWSACIPSIE